MIDFPTLIWYETDCSVYVMRQASRRPWRIGQTRPVKVVFMSYQNTLQADALKLVAKKLQSSLAVEGELPEDGLAAYGDDVEDGRYSRRRKYRKVVRERPGLVPSALFHLIGNTVFLRLSDVAAGLPPYEEQVMLSSMDSEADATGYSQRKAYDTVFDKLSAPMAIPSSHRLCT